MRESLTYLLPIRSRHPVAEELIAYVRCIASHVEFIVIDGSDREVFDDFARRCGDSVRHVGPDPDVRSLRNGKVANVLTGLRLASNDSIVIADDDVRYELSGLQAMAHTLEHAEIVRPQNYFDPLPWHACVDTARTLVNRATGGDWPGTLGVRRSVLVRSQGYDGNVLFENLELVRTAIALGGREARLPDLFVRRLPPDTGRFWSQRVRQAYDEFARPQRLVVWLSLLPLLVWTLATFRWLGVAVAMATPMLVAEIGRRIGQGRRVFPAIATLAAPLWVLERAICAWLALGARVLLGGIPYRGHILKKAATPYRELVKRYCHNSAPH